MKSWMVPAVGVMAAVMLPGLAAADGLQAGQWQVTTLTSLDGAPPVPQRNQRCLTPEAVADLDKTFSPVANTVNSACERVEHEFSPARLKWRLQCRGQVDMDVAGEFVFETPERYTATVTTAMSMAGQLMQSSKAALVGLRIGECSAQ